MVQKCAAERPAKTGRIPGRVGRSVPPEVPFTDTLVADPRAKGNDKLRLLIALRESEGFGAAVRRRVRTAYQGDESGRPPRR